MGVDRWRTFFSIRFFFFELSSPPAARLAFIPFSSPGTGPDSRRAANNAGLGFLNVYPLFGQFLCPSHPPCGVDRTITCLDSYRACAKFKSCVTAWSLSAAVKTICISNSPHPCSAIRNGGFLKAVRQAVISTLIISLSRAKVWELKIK